MTYENKETPGAATPGETILGTAAGDAEAARQSEESELQQVRAAQRLIKEAIQQPQNRGVSADSKIFIGHVALGIDGSFATIGIKNPDDGSYLTATVNDDEVRLLTHALRTINEIAIRGD